MSDLIGYIVKIDALVNHDLDAQAMALEAVPDVLEVEFVGVPGGGSYFIVCIGGEMPANFIELIKHCDSVVARTEDGNWINSRTLALASKAAWNLLGR